MNTKAYCAAAGFAAATLAVVGGSAFACGDKLVALGGGVAFERVVVSRHPGHIVLMLEPATGLAVANDKFNIAASLSLAGHDVAVIGSADELRGRAAAPAPDLILVDASRAGQFRFQRAADIAAPTIMPVFYSADGGDAEPAGQPDGCATVGLGRKGMQLLKAVEKALKLRSRGLPMPCEQGEHSQKA